MTSTTSSTPRNARSSKSVPVSPFGDDNFAISEKDGVVTVQFRLGVNLGPTASEAKRLAEGKPGLGTHTVSRPPQNLRLSDGTAFSASIYSSPKLAASAGKSSEPTAAALLAALPDDLQALIAQALAK